MTPSYPDSTDEDPDDLYPEYLQEILNDDSIVNIGNYFIKIDLVNDKGLTINKSLPESYNILKNSDPNNLSPDSDVMLFGEDEDVLDALDWIDSGEGTYKKYLDEMAGFSVPIFCHDKGAPKKKSKRVDYYDPGDHRVRFKRS